MAGDRPKKYDATIIGAGISGLVCGCYLAQAGMKVLIAERHHRPGGYCTSFRRKGFFFDAAVHSFGGYREGGPVRRVFQELGIETRMAITRHDPSDVVIAPGCRVRFCLNSNETIAEFQAAFPAESGSISKFFRYLETPPPAAFAEARRRTFGQLLDGFFSDEKLKAVLAYPLLGNCGLPPNRLSAFIGAKVFQEFLLDGGYYPAAGMQSLADALAARFTESGGELRLSSEVKRIILDRKAVSGVELADRTEVPSDIVVSNADASHTFNVLVGQDVLPKPFQQRLSMMVPSLSMVVLYLAVDPSFHELPDAGLNVWHLPHYDLETLYSIARADHAESVFMLRVIPGQNNVVAFAQAGFRTGDYWTQNKNRLLEQYIKSIDTCLIPGLEDHLLYREAATPATLFRYTLNQQGASYGWEATPEQLADHDLRQPSFLRGLYLSGHWTTQGLGIPGVIYTGRDTARSILRYTKKNMLC